MEGQNEWEANALLSDGDDLVPCNIQHTVAGPGESDPVRYVWALPLKELKGKPATMLLGEWDGQETDPNTDLPIVNCCEWQPCLCDELGKLLEGHFCFVDEPDTDDEADLDGSDDEPSYQLMVQVENHEYVMVGAWDGKRRDQETALPLVELLTLPLAPANDDMSAPK